MSQKNYPMGSKDVGGPSEYSYETSDDDDYSGDPELTARKEKQTTEEKDSMNQVFAGNMNQTPEKGYQSSTEAALSTMEVNEAFYDRQGTTRPNESKEFREDPAATILLQSAILDADVRMQERREESPSNSCRRALCNRVVCIGCSYLMVLSAGILIGWMISMLITTGSVTTKSSDDFVSTDDFFSAPWIMPEGDLMVGAYYYPWYANNFHGGGYVRSQLSPKQLPTLGEYDDSDPDIIYEHLKWSAQANLRLWVTSWWGPGSLEDDTTKDVILPHPSLGDHRIALFYETSGRIKEEDGYSTDNVIPDIVYMCQEYFAHPNYFRIDGKPVLVVYLTRRLEILGLLDVVISQMRQAARGEGYEIYIVGDHVFKAAPEDTLVFPAFNILDAVTKYV